MSASSARIVLTSFGSLGDLHPYLALAMELKRRGHRPVIATHPGYRARVEVEGVEFHPVRPDVDDFGDEAALMKDVMNARLGPEVVIRRMFMPRLRDSAADLAPALEGADLLLTHTLTFAAPLLAQVRGLPWLSTALAPTAFFSAYDPPILAPAPALNRLRALGPGFYGRFTALLQRMCRSWTAPVHELRADLGLPPTALDPLFAGQFSPLGTLALYSPVLGDPQPDWPERTHLTGFPFYAPSGDAGRLPSSVRAFLDAGPPPIVFTLGSSAVMDAGTFYEESADAACRLGRRALLLIGRDPRNRPEAPLPSEVFAAEYAPHRAVFAGACAVVHQGGIGTTGEALRAGIPMVFLPFGFDQPDNAARVARRGIARVIPRGRYTAHRVALDLEALLADPEVSRRAEAIGRQVDAEEGSQTACDVIERLLGAAR